MRSSPLRLALSLTALLLSLSSRCLAAADAAPAKDAPAAVTPAPTPAPAPAVAPAAVDAPAASVPTPAPAPEPTPAATPAPVAAPAAVPDQDTAEAKLAVVLRSYSLMQEENDQLKAAQEKLTAEKSALEAQLAVAKDALPLANQAAGLREQLRQTQDQLAALSLENNELKTRLSLGGPAAGAGQPESLHPASVATTPAPVALPAPAARIHVVAAGETLGKIARQYYGNANRWPEILAANKDVLKDEKSLFVGTKLKIP